MKTLSDGFEVSARSYYFLLDWNERNECEAIVEKFGVNKLNALNKDQYKELFKHASEDELTKL